MPWQTCLEALRMVHAAEPPGYLSKETVAARWEASGAEDGRRLIRSLRAHGATMSGAWTAAIGEHASLVDRRRWCETERDVRSSIGVAIDAGVRFGPGWYVRWNAFAQEAGWVGTGGLMMRRLRRLGLDVDEVIAEELAARGAPPVVLHGPRRRLDDRPEMIRESLVEADARLEVGRRLTMDALDRAVAGSGWPMVARDLQEGCRRRGLRWEDAVREFLGVQRAVVRGRVTIRSEDEWRMIVRGALQRGLQADARWRERWAAVQAGGLWLPSVRTFADGVGGIRRAFELVREEAGSDAGEIPMRLRAGELTLERVLEALRRVSGEQPPGLMGEPQLNPLLARRADLPSAYALNRALRRHELNLGAAWRAALGRSEALRHRRVMPADADDLHVFVGAALDAGVRLRPGWSRDWSNLVAKDSWIPSHDRALYLARLYDVNLRAIALELSLQRGLPTEPMPPRAPRGGWPRTPLDRPGTFAAEPRSVGDA